MKHTIRTVFFGTPACVIPIITTVQEHFNLVGVVTAPDSKTGRKQLLTPSPVKGYLQDTAKNVDIFTPELLTSETIQAIEQLHPDLFVVAAYGKIIPKALLHIPRYGAINVHPSLLPQYRGASPIQEALLHGDTKTGITLIQMDEEMDHGPILAQEKIPITQQDTLETLHTLLFEKAAAMLPQIIQGFVEKTITPQEQDHRKATFCQRIERENGFIDLSTPPTKEQFYRMVRAYYPWPGVYTTVSSEKGELRIKFLPGNLVQVEGKKPVPVKDFLNGYPHLREKLSPLFA